MKELLQFRLFGRCIRAHWDANGWWITNHKGFKHMLHLSYVTIMEHPDGWATNLTAFRLHITIIKLNPTSTP